jgi:predicted MFS family arabinose efflux permease
MNPRILLLALGVFAIGTESFVVAGLLPTIAGDLGVSVAVAGQLITAFALVFALGAPLLAALTAAWPQRRLLVGALALFTAATILAALTPAFALLLAARMLAAMGAALYTPTALAAAANMVTPIRRGRALALVGAGTTAALVLGVPLGTWAGVLFSWRVTYGLVAGMGALATLSCLALLPDAPAPPVSLRARVAPLVQPRVALGLGVTMFGFLGWFAVHTYIAPLLRQVTHLEGAALSGMLLVYGLASVVGNFLGGYAADRWGSTRTIALSLTGLALALASLPLVAASIPRGIPAVAGTVVSLVAWGVAGWMLRSAQYMHLIALAPTSAAVLLALNASATWLGVAGGAALGGAVISVASPAALGWAGAACQVLALGVLFLGTRRTHPQPASALPVVVAADAR